MIRFSDYMKEAVTLPSKSSSIGIARKDMPQVDIEHVDDFLKYLKSNAVGYSKETVSPDTLSPTQHHFSVGKIEKIMYRIENGTNKKKKILISKNNRVIDGHHAWIAHSNLGKKIDVIRIDAKAKAVVNLMHDYPKSYTKKLHE